MTTATLTTFHTPAAPFTLVVGDDGAVLAAGFTDDTEQVISLIAPGLRPGTLRVRRDSGPVGRAVRDYFDGDVRAIDTVAVRYRSGPFVERAWHELRRVPPGAPIAYGELAKRADRPLAVRAAGQACARNPVSLFVPCHRVIAADGSLHRYGWGLPVKRWLLDHELRSTAGSSGSLARLAQASAPAARSSATRSTS
jgi:methylated-DNA-[protein]-cysteine S-methyltransferase